MDFYNYFVFYFIRRFLNIFFNKKRLKKFAFFIIIFFVIIFILHTNGYCAFEPSDSGNLAYCRSYLSSIENYTRASYDYLGNIWVHANHLDTEMDSVLSKLDLAYQQETSMLDDLDDIEDLLTNIDTSADNIETDVNDMLAEVRSLRVIINTQLPLISQLLSVVNTTIANESDDIQSTLNSESAEIQQEINQDFSDLNELLTQYFFGEDYDNQSYTLSRMTSPALNWTDNNPSIQTFVGSGNSYYTYYYELPEASADKEYHFKVSLTKPDNNTPSMGLRIGLSNNIPSLGAEYQSIYCGWFTNSILSRTYSFTIDSSNTYKYLVISCDRRDVIKFTGDYNEVMEKGQTQSIMDNQTQNAEMIDSTITDSSVDAPFSDLPTDTTQDITESGFTNVFDTIRTTFTTGIARNLVVPIPFTGKNFTINTGSVYGNANLGLVGTLISAFWYFAFSLFIAKDIAKKINMIKSGNLENIQSTNIKEDLL